MDVRRWAGIAPAIALAVVVSACAPSPQVAPAQSAGSSGLVLDGPAAERLAAAWIAQRYGIDGDLVRVDARGSRDRRWFAKVVAPSTIAIIIVWVDLDTGEIGEGDPFPAPDATPGPLLRDLDLALLEILDADEPVNAWATGQPGRGAALAQAARALGMHVDAQGGDEFLAIGTPGAVDALLTLDGLATLRVEERRDADRPVAPAIAVESMPRPGFPYRRMPFPRDSVRTSGEPIPPADVDEILAALRLVVPTADGGPHEEILVGIDCEGSPATCRVRVTGGPRWSGGLDGPHSDALAFEASASDGWILHPAPEPAIVTYGALPRCRAASCARRSGPRAEMRPRGRPSPRPSAWPGGGGFRGGRGSWS